MTSVLLNVFVFYFKCLLLLIPYGLFKFFSKDSSVSDKIINAIKSAFIITIAIGVYMSINDDHEIINVKNWWDSNSGMSLFFYILIASWLGIAMAKNEKSN